MAVLDRAAEVIEGSPLVALACHVTPDGDALGSMLAMHLLCRSQGKESVASWPEPFGGGRPRAVRGGAALHVPARPRLGHQAGRLPGRAAADDHVRLWFPRPPQRA